MRAEVELYAHQHSLLHHWDARWKLAALALLVAAIAMIRDWRLATLGAALALALLALGRLPFKIVLARLGVAQALLLPCLILLPFTFSGQPVTWHGATLSLEGLQVAALLYFRALAILAVAMVGVYTTPMVVLLGTFHALHLPRVVTDVALLTYRYLFTLWWELTRMRWALVTRGFARRSSAGSYRALANVVGVTLIRSLERTERIQHAMLCRGFQGRLRTLHEFSASRSDLLKFTLCLLVAALLLLADRSQWLAHSSSHLP
jgi:cobalt/nickel transport system permease protein